MPIEEKIAKALIKQRKTLATAESCTGGLLANRLTNIPGSSAFYKLGLILYANETKAKLLNIPSGLMKKHGAVSEHVAMAMAQNVRRIHKTDYGIGITGIAGPTGGTKTKPVGLVYIAVSAKHETICLTCQFSGKRTAVKSKSATQALKLLWEFLFAPLI